MCRDSKQTHGIRQLLILVGMVCLFGATASQGQPDLTVADIWESSGQVYFMIKNSGAKTAGTGHRAALTVDNQSVDSVIVSSIIPSGDSYTGVFPKYYWQCVADGSHTVLVEADVYDTISESNEKNNSLQETWICDVTAPKITSGPTATSITETSAVISWITDEGSDSVVWYSTTPKTYTHSETDQTLTTKHKIILDELTADTKYYYRVESTDAYGNTVQSSEYSFQTLAEEVLEITSGPTVTDITQTDATLSWTTNQASDSRVRCGTLSGIYAMDKWNGDHESYPAPGGPGTGYALLLYRGIGKPVRHGNQYGADVPDGRRGARPDRGRNFTGQPPDPRQDQEHRYRHRRSQSSCGSLHERAPGGFRDCHHGLGAGRNGRCDVYDVLFRVSRC